MTAPRIQLDVGGDWISARWEPARPWLRVSRKMPPLACAEHRVEGVPLHEALGEVIARLPQERSRLRPTQLWVRLGMAHARIGLMHLAEANGSRLAADALETYVGAWTRQALHLDPAHQVIRWQVLRDSRHVLVSCIDSDMFVTLTEFAREHGFRFKSCMPALLQEVRSAPRSATQTLAWTEGANEHRSPAVQLLRFERGQVVSTWRGWLPQPACDAPDRELQAAVRRFNARHGSAEADLVHVHWPVATGSLSEAQPC